MIELRIHPRTPLWTGNAEGITDRVHEPGIIGSLRWWYEVILRGLGHRACDPTEPGDERCQDRQHCAACDLFGCTGWARRFRLQLGTGRQAYSQTDRSDTVRFRPPGRSGGWYYGAGQLESSDDGIPGSLILLRDDGETVNNVLIALELAARWGALGAKSQHGYGVVRVEASRGGLPVRPDVGRFLTRYPPRPPADSGLPALTNFFFARIHLLQAIPDDWWRRRQEDDGFLLGVRPADMRKWAGGEPGPVAIAPAVKSVLRYAPGRDFSKAWGNDELLFGSIRGGRRQRARISVSGAYLEHGRWTFRIWGWLTGRERSGRRSGVYADLHRQMGDLGFWRQVFGSDNSVDIDGVVWREFASERDTVLNTDDPAEFLTSLVG